jgi:hypothetical protein
MALHPGLRARGESLPAVPAAPWRQRLVAAVSLLTAVWLAAQLAVGMTKVVVTWPVVAFPMFSQARDATVQRSLQARTASGRVARVGPADYGLTELQLLNFERRIVSDAGMVTPQAATQLGRLAGAWNRAHPGDPVISMTLTGRVRPLGGGAAEGPARVVVWSAP